MGPNVVLPEWAERVLVEEKQLSQNIHKLYSFIGTDEFKKTPHKELLINQHVAMSEYHSVLEDRIKLIKTELV